MYKFICCIEWGIKLTVFAVGRVAGDLPLCRPPGCRYGAAGRLHLLSPHCCLPHTEVSSSQVAVLTRGPTVWEPLCFCPCLADPCGEILQLSFVSYPIFLSIYNRWFDVLLILDVILGRNNYFRMCWLMWMVRSYNGISLKLPLVPLLGQSMPVSAASSLCVVLRPASTSVLNHLPWLMRIHLSPSCRHLHILFYFMFCSFAVILLHKSAYFNDHFK